MKMGDTEERRKEDNERLRGIGRPAARVTMTQPVRLAIDFNCHARTLYANWRGPWCRISIRVW